MCEHSDQPIPRAALIGAAVLIGFSLLAAWTAQVSGVGKTQVSESVPVQSRDLLFQDRADGAVVIYEAGDERAVKVLAPGTNGFVRGVMRGLARERRRQAVDSSYPVRLTLWLDGRLSLDDPATSYHGLKRAA